MAEIIQFNIEELRKKNILPETDPEEIILDNVMAGEVTVGTLTDDERTLYVNMVDMHTELQECSKELTARMFEAMGGAVRKSDTPAHFHKNAVEESRRIFEDTDQAEAFFKLESQYELIRAHFNMAVRQRFGFGSIYGIRTGYTVVRVEKKYEVMDTVVNFPNGQK